MIGRKQYFGWSQMSGQIRSLLSSSTGSLRLRAKKEPSIDRFYVRRRAGPRFAGGDRKSTRLNSSHGYISYAVFCLKKKKKNPSTDHPIIFHRILLIILEYISS